MEMMMMLAIGAVVIFALIVAFFVHPLMVELRGRRMHRRSTRRHRTAHD